MAELNAASFFNYSDYTHAALFEGTTYVWEALARLPAYILKQRLGQIEVEIPQGVFLENPEKISIGKGTVVEPGAYIQGPCIIGKECTIRHGAYIRGDVVTGNRCVIGHDTEVKHSIFLNEACAAHFNYVGDCILGNKVNLGAGVKCANLRLDHHSVTIFFKGEKIVTGLKKLGAIIGDEAQLGCNAVTNPGTLMGKKSFCYPCLNFGGYLAPHAIVRHQMTNSNKE